MNRSKLSLTLAVICLVGVIFFSGYVLSDINHAEKQLNSCTETHLFPRAVDGWEVANKAIERLKDYQLEYHLDTLKVWDSERLVGMHIDSLYLHGAFIDSLILDDNR